MSGGSFNYLCYKAENEELCSSLGTLQEMVETLAEYVPKHPEVAAAHLESKQVLEMFQVANARAKKLAGVWKAVEWHRSGDWGEMDVVEEIEMWLARPKGDVK